MTTAPVPEPTREILRQAWDLRIARLLARLPVRAQRAIAWLRDPSRSILRIAVALLFMVGGVFSILPILGLWMLPVGVALLSDDVPGIKAPAERCARAVDAAWGRASRWWSKS